MKMNSINKRKSRIKVVASKRHNLSLNRSSSVSKLGKLSGDSTYRIRINSLLKNNKNLAVALQVAKGELSEKQNLLEKAAKHFKDILQARVLLLGMYSDLKSLVEKFDGALSLLNVGDIKISDLIVPFSFCGEFKRKVKRLAESVQQVSEENSFLVREDVNCDSNMTETSNQITLSDYNPSIDSNAMEATNKCVDKENTNLEAEHCLPLSIENTCNSMDIIPNAIDSDPIAVQFCENLEETVVSHIEKTTTPAKNDSTKNRESSGTPRLSILSIDTLKKSEVLPKSKARVTFDLPSSTDKVVTDVLNTQASSSKVKSSKIPRLFNSSATPKIELDLPGNVIKHLDISSQKTSKISENSDSDVARRKTFVVKRDTLVTNSESENTFSMKEIRNENNFTNADSKPTNSRKTFVVKVQDIPKPERKSISNRRKTFIKKRVSTINKIPKSLENKRKTFVISETKEDCNNENVTISSEISTSKDFVRSKCLPSEETLSEELPVFDKTIEITKCQESLDNMNLHAPNISLQNQSQQIPFKEKDIVPETNKTTLEQEFKLENDSNCDVKENLCKAKNVNKKLSTVDEPSDICVISEECVQSAMPNDIDIIEIKDNKRNSRTQKSVSYKAFLETSDSECESIGINLDAISFIEESSGKPVPYPIRKVISGSKKKKVFVFEAHKTKSIVSKVKKKSMKKSVGQKFNCVSDSDNIDIKNEDVIIELSKDQGNEKVIECVSENSTCNKSSNNKNGSEYCGTSDNNQEILQSEIISGKNTDISRGDPNEKLSVFKSGESNVKNPLSLFNSPVIISHKFLNAIEPDKDLVDQKVLDIKICKSKTKSIKHCNISSKSNQVTDSPLKDYPVDSIAIKKTYKRTNSKKGPRKTITADVQDTKISNTLQNEIQEKQTKKKYNSKSKKNGKKSPSSMSNDNSIVVQAEVHSPSPQEYFTALETTDFNKENKSKLESENCLVLLNDIFKPTSIEKQSLPCKNKMVSNDRNIPSKIPFSDNSSNIPHSSEVSHSAKNEESIASNVQGTRHSKRVKKVNYAEPSLSKKMRR